MKAGLTVQGGGGAGRFPDVHALGLHETALQGRSFEKSFWLQSLPLFALRSFPCRRLPFGSGNLRRFPTCHPAILLTPLARASRPSTFPAPDRARETDHFGLSVFVPPAWRDPVPAPSPGRLVVIGHGNGISHSNVNAVTLGGDHQHLEGSAGVFGVARVHSNGPIPGAHLPPAPNAVVWENSLNAKISVLHDTANIRITTLATQRRR